MKTKPKPKLLLPLAKIPSGISGLDEITGGGLPKGRPRWFAAPRAAARR